MTLESNATREFAVRCDREDALSGFRDQFLFPQTIPGKDDVYFCGNSLGLQPKTTKAFIEQELEDWHRYGVRGHFAAKNPWYPYHEFLTEKMAKVCGAKAHEVVVMNSLTVNLHLMLVSFYRPTKERFKILIEGGAFPSDRYAVYSQARFHGFDPREAVVELVPRPGEETLRQDDIEEAIAREGGTLALLLLGNVNFLTGQAFDMKRLSKAAHAVGAMAGFDLAHGAGNLTLHLHDDGCDFAVWCSYKYLNAGPGGISGVFVHERHAHEKKLPRFEGWWGHDKAKRFKMEHDFSPIVGAEAWQLSNPPIFQMAALRASLEIFDAAGRERLAKKRDHLTSYLEFLLTQLPSLQIITPKDSKERGSQLSVRLKKDPKAFVEALEKDGIVCDLREPDIMRISPVPLYTRYQDVYSLYEVLKSHVGSK